MTTPTPNQPDTDARAGNQWGLTPEQLAAIRNRLSESARKLSGDGTTAGFRKWRKAKKAVREFDALFPAVETAAAVAGKDPQ